MLSLCKTCLSGRLPNSRSPDVAQRNPGISATERPPRIPLRYIQATDYYGLPILGLGDHRVSILPITSNPLTTTSPFQHPFFKDSHAKTYFP